MIVLTILTVLCVLMIFCGHLFKNDDVLCCGWFALGLVALIGWGLCGLAVPATKRVTLLNKNQYELVKHKSYVEWCYSEDLTYKSHDYSYVMNADHMKVYLVHNYNLYGYAPATPLEFRVSEN